MSLSFFTVSNKNNLVIFFLKWPHFFVSLLFTSQSFTSPNDSVERFFSSVFKKQHYPNSFSSSKMFLKSLFWPNLGFMFNMPKVLVHCWFLVLFLSSSFGKQFQILMGFLKFSLSFWGFFCTSHSFLYPKVQLSHNLFIALPHFFS